MILNGDISVQCGLATVRVSTEDQDTTVQMGALKSAGCERIFCEKVYGDFGTGPSVVSPK